MPVEFSQLCLECGKTTQWTEYTIFINEDGYPEKGIYCKDCDDREKRERERENDRTKREQG